MMIRQIFSLLVALASVTTSWASEPSLTQLETYLNSINTLQAAFIQTTTAYPQPWTGSLAVERAGRLRWEYMDGAALNRLRDGRLYWQNSQGTLTQLPGVPPLLDLLGARTVDLTSADAPVKLVAAVPSANGVVQWQFTPVEPDAGIQELVLFTAQNPWQVMAFQTVDQLGNTTFVELAEVSVNVVIDDAAFPLRPPEEANLFAD